MWLADSITRFTGSMPFVYLHLLLFGGWIIANLPGVPLPHFDPTFVALAMVASVEAIFLSTFILITQNRMTAQAERKTREGKLGTIIRSIRRQGPAARTYCWRMVVRLKYVHTLWLGLCCSPRSITSHHLDAEIRKLFDALWRTGIVRHHTTRFWGKTERQRHVKLLECLHLPVEPRQRLLAQAIGTAQTGT